MKNKKELEKKLKSLIGKTLIANKNTTDLFSEARTLGLQDVVVKKAINDIKAGKPEKEVLDKLEEQTNIIEEKEKEEQEKIADSEHQAKIDPAKNEAIED